ncbi:hypothetical protein [Micromonospora sp.]
MVDPTAPLVYPTDESDQPDAPSAEACTRPAPGRTIRASAAGTVVR